MLRLSSVVWAAVIGTIVAFGLSSLYGYIDQALSVVEGFTNV